MSRATSDDQLKFLLSCVKHSNNGKIDFVEVAQECGVVSKGAAAKRYERLMKANGINPNGGPDPKPSTISAPKVPKNNQPEGIAKPPAKRRRTNNTATATTGTARKEGMPVTPKPKIEQTTCVETEGISNSLANSFPVPQPMDNQPGPTHQEETSFDFDEFCSPEMFEQCASNTNHLSQGHPSAPALVSKMETVSANRVEETPQLVQDHMKMEKKPERETVVIAD